MQHIFEGLASSGFSSHGNTLLHQINFKTSLKIEAYNRSTVSSQPFFIDYTCLIKTGIPSENNTLLTSSSRKMSELVMTSTTLQNVVDISGSGYLLAVEYYGYYASGSGNVLGTISIDGVTGMSDRTLYNVGASTIKLSLFQGPLRFNSNLTVGVRISAAGPGANVRAWYTLD
ncbi:hypothetical protein D3C76_981850 [compost metagenome]